VSDAVTICEYKPKPLLAVEMTLRLRQSSFVFAKHETAHEYGTEHNDQAK
jgi:hypothetical protein